MTGNDRRNQNNALEIYGLSASADGAEICSPMEPNHILKMAILLQQNILLKVSVHIS